MKKLIRTIAVITAVAALAAGLAATASAEYVVRCPSVTFTTVKPYECGKNAEWSFEEESGILRIKGTGEMKDFGNEDKVPWRSFADKITNVIVEEGITYISNYAFSHCKNLVGVSIPSTCERIGECAFYHCDALPHIFIPKSVEYIENMAFGETGLKTVAFEGSPNGIHKWAFLLVGRIDPCIVYCPEDFSLTARMRTPKEWYGGYFNFVFEDNYRD